MSQPNILLITTDQQRFDTLGKYKPSFLRTPHLDQLAHEGISFASAYSDCPVCVPARTTLMTGRSGLSHGLTGNRDTSEVMGREDTLPSCLRDAGYQTAAIGKMHFGPQRVRHGFDEMILPDDYYRAMRRSGNPLQPMRHGLGQNEMYPTMATVPESQTLTSWTAEQCVSYIRDRRDPSVPFFLWCSFSKPHPPFDPPEPYYSMYRHLEIPDPVIGDWLANEAPPELKQTAAGMKYDEIPTEIWREARAAYYGLITQIDYNIGRVFAALMERDLYKETVIIFTSDHGEFLGDHHCGGKSFGYEGSAHVPFILRLPGSIQPRRHGSQVSTPITLADLLPTVLNLAGTTVPTKVTGESLLSLSQDPRYAIGVGGGNVRTTFITDGRYKYHWFCQGAVEQFFDLQRDPYEKTLLSEHESLPRLKEALIHYHQNLRTSYVDEAGLVEDPLLKMTDQDLRAGCGLGLHTDEHPHDVRH